MNRKEKTELILNKSISIFSKYGYKKTTIEEIANELGMTKGNIYLYFKDKKDLYEKSVAQGLKRWQKSATESIDRSASSSDQLIQFATNGWKYLSGDPEMQNIVVNDPSVFPLYPEDDHFYKINFDSINVLKEIILEGIKSNEFRKMDVDYSAQFLYSLYVMFIIRTYIKSEDITIGKIIDAAKNIILNGMNK